MYSFIDLAIGHQLLSHYTLASEHNWVQRSHMILMTSCMQMMLLTVSTGVGMLHKPKVLVPQFKSPTVNGCMMENVSVRTNPFVKQPRQLF